MGSVAVLQAKDCLSRDRFFNYGRRRRSIPMSNPNPNPSPNMNRSGGRRKRSPGRNINAADNNASPTPAKELVMEKVKILKRGEALDDIMSTIRVSNSLLKSDDEKSKSGRKKLLKKNDKKVRFGGVLRNLDEDLKSEKVNLEDCEKEVNVDLNLKDDLRLSTTDWLGPVPEMLPNLSNFYAGYSIGSPSPSSLPLPPFFAKKSDLTTDLSNSPLPAVKKSVLNTDLSTSPLPPTVKKSAKNSNLIADLSTSPLPVVKKSDLTMDLSNSPFPAFSAKKSDPTIDLIRMLGLNL